MIYCRPNEPAEKAEEIPEKPSKDGKVASKEDKTAEEKAKQEANLLATQENLKKALSKLTKESLARGRPLIEDAFVKFQAAIDQLPEEDKNKPLKPLPVSHNLL